MPVENPHRLYRGHYLPHCEAGGRPQIITFRLADSIPREVYAEMTRRASSQDEIRALAQRYLDKGRGHCHLKLPEAAQVVEGALKFYAPDRYKLVDWVIMPNHVHVVYDHPTESVGKIVEDWKGYTASEINKLLGRKGSFWKTDYFDRYARDEHHFSNMQFYTILNPVRAGLVSDPFDWPFSSVHDYPPDFKEDLRRWYRVWKERYWDSLNR